MGHDLLREDPVSMGWVANQFPGARGAEKVNPATVSRWCNKGVKRGSGVVIRLESYRIGSRLMTTKQAVARFVAALTSADVNSSSQPEVRTPAARQSAAAAAARELERMGA